MSVYNYSIQSGSSTASQLATLRAKLQQDPDHVHAYGPHLYSQVVPKVDVADEQRMERLESEKRWKTVEGFWAGYVHFC